MADARFEDGAETALNLAAVSVEDLSVISALCQDAVLQVGDIRRDAKSRRLAMLINRFRWEDAEAARREGRPYERTRALLIVGDVTRIAAQGVGREDPEMVLSILSLAWEPGEDGTGRLVVTLAGDGALAIEAECLDVSLRDVTRPYAAPSGKAPHHPE